MSSFWRERETINYFAEKPADPRIEDRISKINNLNRCIALDLGCGGGRHSELLCKAGSQLYACDTNPEMIIYTRKRVENYFKNKNIGSYITYGSILDIPFKDNFFDVVITTGVLHQAASLDEYRKATEELSRVCKKGAVVCLNIFTNKVWDETYTKLEGEEYTVITQEDLYMTLLPKELFIEMMEKSGLRLESELSEDIKQENTGPRAVFRANFIKF